MEIQKFMRVPLVVDAVQVTAQNMAEVATWCKGKIDFDERMGSYIKVDAVKPMRERQTRAYCTDWVLHTESGFKVYTNKAMPTNFLPVVPDESKDCFPGCMEHETCKV